MAKQKDAPAPQQGEVAQQVEGLKELHKSDEPEQQLQPADPPASKPSTPHVLTALQHVQARFSRDGLSKNRQNEQQKYKFRGIDDVYNSLSTYLTEAGLIIVPRVLSRDSEERTTKNGGLLIYSHVMVEFDFYSSVDGSKITAGPLAGEAMDSADKSTNKAQSAAYKYLCLQTFCIPTEGDNDADATTHQPAPKDDTDQPPVGSKPQQPKQSSAPARQAQPQREAPKKESVDFHVKAINAAENETALKKAFALAWKQYENPNNSQVTTPAQAKFKQKYDERKVALGGGATEGGGASDVEDVDTTLPSGDEPTGSSEFDDAMADGQ